MDFQRTHMQTIHKSSQMHAAVPRLSQCVHADLQCTACSFSPYHCSWLQGKFSARFVTWLSVPQEPPHWGKTKCNVTWQGFKNKESLVCNIITFIPNTKIMYVKRCNWPLFCTLAFINIYMYLKIMCVYIYIKETAQFCKHECYFPLRDFV